jgi:glycosyltransferase involved in cell wall biosynthesis
MRIGIDARLLSTKIRGTSRYLSNIIEYLPQYDKKNQYFVFQYEDVPQTNKLFYSYLTIKKSRLPRQIYEHYWLNFVLPKLMSKFKIDVFFTPYIFVPLFNHNWKNVIVIHDSLTKVCKQYYTYHYRKYIDFLLPLSVERSDAIVTVSKSAMDDIIRFYNVPRQKIQYLYHWTDDKYKPLNISQNEKNNILEKYGLPERFIFFVSVIEERKNILGILKVSEILMNRGIDIKTVFIGRAGFGFNDVADKFKSMSERIIHLKEVDDHDLVLLYNLATVFFFPTHYEGFGFPVLEAMKCGLPVVASDNSSIPEVVGDGGVMGNANDYEFFADKITLLLQDQDYYASLKQKALQQAQKFTAENHISKLINIFNSF